MRQSGPRRVLVVDYYAGVARSLELLFAHHGCECRVVESGEAAIATAATWVPDAVVMDFILAGMLGLEAARVLRKKYPECKVVLLYSGVAMDLEQEATDEGFIVLKKPVGPEVLLEAVGIF